MSEEAAQPVAVPVAEEPAKAAAKSDGSGSPKKEKSGGKGQKGKGKGKGKTKGKEGKGKGWEFSGPSGSGGYRLNVKNLSNDTTTKEQLKALFEPFGAISGAEVKMRDDGSSRGFGYVILPDEEAGKKAIAEMNGKTIGGKALNVAPAERRPTDDQGPGGGAASDFLAQQNAMYMMQMQQVQQAYMAQAYMQQAYMANSLAAMGMGGGIPPWPGMPLPGMDVGGAAGGEYIGTLKSVNPKNGYGFITCAETHALYDRDVYVDSELIGAGIKTGSRLRFTVTINNKGHPKAATAVPI